VYLSDKIGSHMVSMGGYTHVSLIPHTLLNTYKIFSPYIEIFLKFPYTPTEHFTKYFKIPHGSNLNDALTKHSYNNNNMYIWNFLDVVVY